MAEYEYRIVGPYGLKSPTSTLVEFARLMVKRTGGEAYIERREVGPWKRIEDDDG